MNIEHGAGASLYLPLNATIITLKYMFIWIILEKKRLCFTSFVFYICCSSRFYKMAYLGVIHLITHLGSFKLLWCTISILMERIFLFHSPLSQWIERFQSAGLMWVLLIHSKCIYCIKEPHYFFFFHEMSYTLYSVQYLDKNKTSQLFAFQNRKSN